MEDIHGVDVSWLHHTSRGEQRVHSATKPARRNNDREDLHDLHTSPDHHHRQQAPSSPGLTRDVPPRTSANGGLPTEPVHEKPGIHIETAPAVQKPITSPPPTSPSPSAAKTPPKRPPLLGRGSSERNGSPATPDAKGNLRKGSWISSISSKFSSGQGSPSQPQITQAHAAPAHPNGVNGASPVTNGTLNGSHTGNGSAQSGLEPYVPQQPKGSFISNALRRFSSGSQVSGGKVTPSGGVCPRKVMNVDHNRDRCLVPELDQNKLRRVAFCVDVEIAGGPRYKDEDDSEEKKKKRKEKKMKERGEGEALKHPDAVAEEKEKDGIVKVSTIEEDVGKEDAPNPEGRVLNEEKKEPNKKKEKKKRSEAERKERKEKKRRRAEENGSIPLELTRDDDEEDLNNNPTDGTPGSGTPRAQDRPTTDPLRIYRRCCQLRETPILKRISDQLSAPSACLVETPGVVTCLDLTGSRLQHVDVVTLGDWLAVVPVKKLLLEDAELNDEKVRVILAGLLAAKVSESSRRRSSTVNGNNSYRKVEERAGVVEKLVLKNNPKIGREGWRHISLFLYMCKSLKAIDVSMIAFPKPVQKSALQSNPQTPTQSSTSVNGSSAHWKNAHSIDIAETLSKSISERLGGSKLEELVMAECSLTSAAIRKVIDAVVMSGVQRLSLAGNDIDSEGLEHVCHYIRSGVCFGLDLGGNDLQDGILKVVECLTKDCPLWALSLADCNLTPESLKPLFPALVGLPTLKFLDLSHNPNLFSNSTSLCILRKYIPQLRCLKRLHLLDVSLTPAEAIGVAEVLPECPMLAHLNILENPEISKLATATDEDSQQEACALYASLLAAARVSHTLICIDVDVPSPDASEVVKALAKQVVAYCLRNMENFSEIPELKPQKEVAVPDVLMHLVGHTEGFSENHDDDEPAPDDDYIVGGTGVVKALSYCLSQKASDLRRTSLPGSGTMTPRSHAEELEQSTKAKNMSKNLLGSARNIRARLQPALAREAKADNDMNYRRLLFLDSTLQGMIQRFEDEFPDCRLQSNDAASTHSSVPSSTSPPASTTQTLSTNLTENTGADSDEDEPKALRSRHNSDVSLASRALAIEEGRIHRLGHRVRAELINSSRPSSAHFDQSPLPGTHDDDAGLPNHLLALRENMATYSGDEIREMAKQMGWEEAFNTVVENAEELRRLEHENPEEFIKFRQTQIAALQNRQPDTASQKQEKGTSLPPIQSQRPEEDDFAVED